MLPWLARILQFGAHVRQKVKLKFLSKTNHALLLTSSLRNHSVFYRHFSKLKKKIKSKQRTSPGVPLSHNEVGSKRRNCLSLFQDNKVKILKAKLK